MGGLQKVDKYWFDILWRKTYETANGVILTAEVYEHFNNQCIISRYHFRFIYEVPETLLSFTEN